MVQWSNDIKWNMPLCAYVWFENGDKMRANVFISIRKSIVHWENVFLYENWKMEEKKRGKRGMREVKWQVKKKKLQRFIWVTLVNIWRRKCRCIYLASDKIICVSALMISALSTSHRFHFLTILGHFFPHSLYTGFIDCWTESRTHLEIAFHCNYN